MARLGGQTPSATATQSATHTRTTRIGEASRAAPSCCIAGGTALRTHRHRHTSLLELALSCNKQRTLSGARLRASRLARSATGLGGVRWGKAVCLLWCGLCRGDGWTEGWAAPRPRQQQMTPTKKHHSKSGGVDASAAACHRNTHVSSVGCWVARAAARNAKLLQTVSFPLREHLFRGTVCACVCVGGC